MELIYKICICLSIGQWSCTRSPGRAEWGSPLHRAGWAEPLFRPGMRFGGFDFPVFGRSGSHERTEQSGGCLFNLCDRTMERRFVRCGRSGETADLPYILQSCCMDLIVCRGRIEVVQRFYVPAHVNYLRLASSARFPQVRLFYPITHCINSCGEVASGEGT